MGTDTLFVFALLLTAVVMFMSSRVRLDATALLVIVAFALSGVLTLQEAVAGFANPTVLLIAGLFVVGEGLVRSGVAYAVGDWLMRAAGRSENRLLILLMLCVSALGAFMSSTGVVAIFIPIVLSISSRIGVAPGRLMMPMAFAALISGMMTLIATPPNLVINDELRRAGLETFGFFSFTPIGLFVLGVGIVYMLFLGRKLVPSRLEQAHGHRARRSLHDLVSDYGLMGRERRLRLAGSSPLVGNTVVEARLRTRYGANVFGVERRGRFEVGMKAALADLEFRPGDVLLVDMIGSQNDLDRFCDTEKLELLPFTEANLVDATQSLGAAEVMLPPDSELIGRTLREAAFRSRRGLNVVGIRRERMPVSGNIVDEKLAFGDTLLVVGAWKQLRRLRSDPHDFIVLSLPAEIDEVAPDRSRAPFALLSLVGMIVLMTFEVVPNLVAVLLAGFAMGLFRCVDMESAYQSINWQSIVLIAGMLPFATALEKTGGVDLIVHGLMAGVGSAGPIVVMAALFALTAVIGLFVSNTATAVLMAPIAVGAAEQLGVSAQPLAMTVAIAASAAFLTPVSSPVNTLVMGPGQYRFGDFFKAGLPMVVFVMIVTLVAVPVLFPL